MANPLSYKESYIKNLPHIQPPGATFFITYRLAGSLPISVIKQLVDEFTKEENSVSEIVDSSERSEIAYQSQKRIFSRWDMELDNSSYGPHWLSNPTIAGYIKDSLHYHDDDLYELDAYCVMSNHVHVILTPRLENEDRYIALSRILHSLKSYTATKSNRLLSRSGQFWQHESYDHIVRDRKELNGIREYVLNNPVRVGLVVSAEQWPWSFSRYWAKEEN